MSDANNISIRPATAADVPVIRAFICGLAEYEKLSHEIEVTDELLSEHLFGPRPAAEAIIARLGEKPVGFALFFTTFSTFVGLPGLYLEDLFVLPEHRRSGIGAALLREMARITVGRGYGRLEWSVLDWNEPAIRLYRKIGAVAQDDWTIQRLVGEPLLRLAEKL